MYKSFFLFCPFFFSYGQFSCTHGLLVSYYGPALAIFVFPKCPSFRCDFTSSPSMGKQGKSASVNCVYYVLKSETKSLVNVFIKAGFRKSKESF